MENKKNIFDFAGMVLIIFGFSMIFMMVFTVICGEDARGFSTMFALGKQGVPVTVMAQFLFMAVLIVLARWVFFTDFLIKKSSITIRTIGMFLTVILISVCFIIAFRWFPVNMWKPWFLFFICFGISAGVSLIVVRLKEKIENKKMEEGLKRLREEWKVESNE